MVIFYWEPWLCKGHSLACLTVSSRNDSSWKLDHVPASSLPPMKQRAIFALFRQLHKQPGESFVAVLCVTPFNPIISSPVGRKKMCERATAHDLLCQFASSHGTSRTVVRFLCHHLLWTCGSKEESTLNYIKTASWCSRSHKYRQNHLTSNIWLTADPLMFAPHML